MLVIIIKTIHDLFFSIPNIVDNLPNNSIDENIINFEQDATNFIENYKKSDLNNNNIIKNSNNPFDRVEALRDNSYTLSDEYKQKNND